MAGVAEMVDTGCTRLNRRVYNRCYRPSATLDGRIRGVLPTISVIIPTYHRPKGLGPHFLERLLRYFRRLKFPHPIVIADSSIPPTSDANQRIATSMRDVLMVDYRRYSPGIDAYLKIARALGTVDSKYAVICADDDFIIPRAMERCVQFLERNPDYAVAHGRLVSMFPTRHSRNDSKTRLWIYDRSLRTVDSSDPRVRLYEFASKCEGTLLYSVHRRLNLMHNAKIAAKAARDFSFQCLLLECLSMIQGKLRYLDNLYGVRPYNPDSIGSTDTSLRWDRLLTSKDFSQRYATFHNAVAQELVKVARVPKPEANDVVKNAFSMSLTRALYGTYENAIRARKARGLKWAMPIALIQMMPAAARSAVLDKKAVAMLRNPRDFARMIRLEHRLSKQGYVLVDRLLSARTPFRTDFLPIYESIMKGPDGRTSG